MRRNKELDRAANQRKSAQLGLPFSTACNRLRKKILFHLLSRLGENFCFQCGVIIESEGELSIEHRTPWFGGDTSLFWDIENITFSHLGCNVGAGNRSTPRGGGHNKKVGPEGTAWCALHREFLPTDQFARNRKNWNGLKGYCSECKGLLRKPHSGHIK
jgi:5-methylcytosine-specific restriction endonuclease McrA